jgi:NAD(P)H-quinone oxidoreductase subunit 5
MLKHTIEITLLFLLLLPLAISLGLGLSLLLRFDLPEKWVKQMAGTYFSLSVLLVLLLIGMNEFQTDKLTWSYGLFKTYRIDVVLMVDRFALIYLLFSVTLIALIGRFAFTYLHREEGFHRFFILLHLAAFGLQIAITAGCLDLLWVGWECLGISSVLLVNFFYERKGPVDNGLYIFFIYRLGDLALLTVGLWLHTTLGTTHYQQILTPQNIQILLQNGNAYVSVASFICVLIVASAIVKASLFPFINWLPRAMEGPTPSSAVFYGALSTHLGIFLLLRMFPLLQATPGILPLLIVLGVISVILGTLFGQIQTDAKNSLADATIVQLGLMLIEIGLGWTTLAQIHLFSHALLRSYQFLKVPSALHTHHEITSLYGGSYQSPGLLFWQRLPKRLQRWLYFVALERALLEAVFDRILINPLLKLSRRLNQWDEHWLQSLSFGISASSNTEPSAPLESSDAALRALKHELLVIETPDR